MKKIIRLLIIIVFFYLIFNYLLGKSNDLIQYKINEIEIKETHHNGTYFEISLNGLNFNFWSFGNLSKKIITDVKYYSGNDYKCIFPIFKNNKIYTDVICMKNDIQYLYNTMDNIPPDLSSFRNQFILLNDSDDQINNLGMLTIYKNNLLENKYLIINSYKGIYILSKSSQKELILFEKDIYNPRIKFLIDKYYIIADYNQDHEFSNFYIIDVETGKKSILKTNYLISFDSIVEGTYNNNLYLFDPDEKIQYKINPQNMSISITGSERKGIKIYNEGLKNYKLNELSDYQFKYNNSINNYDLLGTCKNTYYYLLNKNVYKANKNNSQKLTYLFKNTYTVLKYDKDYLCMLDDDIIYCYNDLLGIKKIVQNKELSFNKSLSYEVYSK